ncbi:MAG TPA: T9SS type A sorting domain-containing protein [Bacteroidia bacterium]|nr:T9SS type A sorting domain-containing protein [Bacteroidia bacterium]
MKKSLLIAAAVISVFFTKAQSSFSVSVDTVPYPTAQHHYVFNTDTSNHASPTEMLEFKIKNTSSSTKLIKIRKNTLVNAAGQDMYFCFNQTCYGSGTVYSVASMAAGASLPNGNNSYGLRTEFDAWSVIGTSIVRYTIYDSTNTSDSMNITITYNVTGATGIRNINSNVYVSNAAPNPASNVVNFTYDLGNMGNTTAVKIYNSLGTLVKTAMLNPLSKTTQVDVSGLEEGFYFYSVVSNDKVISTKRMVIAR